MAIFHLAAQIIGRSSGRSATAAAAYRAGTCIVDARTGQVHGFTRKGGVREAFILAPATAPAWMRDRSSLWNGVEAAERRKDAQLAREIEISLPHELMSEQRRALLIKFITDEFVHRGMVADVAMHAPGKRGDRRNEHAHVMLTLREINGGGFGNKARQWNDSALIEHWRASWARRVNEALETTAISEYVDHRSYKRQGLAAGHDVPLAALPTVHLGPQATAMERRGVATVPGDLNREVWALNLELARTRQQIQDETKQRETPPPSPTEPPRKDDVADRREQLQRDLRGVLGLSVLQSAAESREVVHRKRDELPTIGHRRLQESEAFQAATRRSEEACRHVKALGTQLDAIEAHLRNLKQHADRHKAAMQWHREHRLLAWLHQVGIMKSRNAVGVVDPDDLQRQWKQTQYIRAEVQDQLAAAGERHEAASQARLQVHAMVDEAARKEAREAELLLERAERLADELQSLEDAEQQMRISASPPMRWVPNVDHDDESRRPPAP